MKRAGAEILLTMSLVVTAAGCVAHKTTWIDVKPFEAYSAHSTVEGISLAADPYDNPQKAQDGFSFDVCSSGFYPVHLIFQNGTDDRVMILRPTIDLIGSDGKTYNPIRSTVMSDACEHSKTTQFCLLGLIGYMSAEEANRKMASDWHEKEVPESLIILPRRNANGFVYFQLSNEKIIKGSTLRLEIEKIENKRKVKFELKL